MAHINAEVFHREGSTDVQRGLSELLAAFLRLRVQA